MHALEPMKVGRYIIVLCMNHLVIPIILPITLVMINHTFFHMQTNSTCNSDFIETN